MADICPKCFDAARAELVPGGEPSYVPMCVPCLQSLSRRRAEKTVVPNPCGGVTLACAACRRSCEYMRLAGGRPMCWECFGWWKRCANEKEYVTASARLFARLEHMGLGHVMTDEARTLFGRRKLAAKPSPNARVAGLPSARHPSVVGILKKTAPVAAVEEKAPVVGVIEPRRVPPGPPPVSLTPVDPRIAAKKNKAAEAATPAPAPKKPHHLPNGRMDRLVSAARGGRLRC